MALRTHLFPYRTQKLSSIASMVLGGRPPGRVDRCRIISIQKRKYSRIAQSAEHLTVNKSVCLNIVKQSKTESERTLFLIGSSNWARTSDPLFYSQMLCQLSYGRIFRFKKRNNPAAFYSPGQSPAKYHRRN